MHFRGLKHVQFLCRLAGSTGTPRSPVPRGVAGVLLAVLALAFAPGCEHATGRGGASPFAPETSIGSSSDAERDSALSVLTSMNRTAFDSAFVHLQDRSFTRRTRTAQIDPGGPPVGLQERTIRYERDASTGTVVAASDSGASFESGPFDRFLPAANPSDRPSNLAVSALPDNPAYLSPRTREAFRYRIRPTIYRETPVWRVEVQARPDGKGPDQSVRYARLTVTRDSLRTLVAAHTVRAERALLFQEDSRLAVDLQPSNGAWLPAETRFHARLDVPFRDPLEFRSTSTYDVD